MNPSGEIIIFRGVAKRVDKRMRSRCLWSVTKVRQWNGAVSADREHLEWFKEVIYAQRHAPASRETILMSIGVGSALDEVRERMVSMWNRRPLGSSTVGCSYTKAGRER